MKKGIIAITIILGVFSFASCGEVTYIENQFYSNEILEEALVPQLPKPNGEMLYRVGTSVYCDKIYIASEESPEEYFQRILDYVQELDFQILGTVDWVWRTVGNLFLMDDSYAFKSTKDKQECSVEDYCNDEDAGEPYYSIIFSNNEIMQGEYHEPYQHPEREDIYIGGYYDYYFIGTLIRVCVDYKHSIEYEGGIFEYDYYLEVRENEQIRMDYDYSP